VSFVASGASTGVSGIFNRRSTSSAICLPCFSASSFEPRSAGLLSAPQPTDVSATTPGWLRSMISCA
jgi:hypothetical protein